MVCAVVFDVGRADFGNLCPYSNSSNRDLLIARPVRGKCETENGIFLEPNYRDPALRRLRDNTKKIEGVGQVFMKICRAATGSFIFK
jgi:hypothetical protein